MRRGARPLPGFTEYQNPLVGYGALCVRDSLSVCKFFIEIEKMKNIIF